MFVPDAPPGGPCTSYPLLIWPLSYHWVREFGRKYQSFPTLVFNIPVRVLLSEFICNDLWAPKQQE